MNDDGTMSLKKHGKNNKPNPAMENQQRHSSEYPTREELVSQLAQLRSSLEGAYETLDSIAPSSDPEVTHKVADMVEVINGLHECEFELMDLLAKDGQVGSPTPGRSGDNPAEKSDEKVVVAPVAVEDESRSRTGSQEDLSVYGAYAVSSSRSIRNAANELSKAEKSDLVETAEPPGQVQIPPQERIDYLRRLEEIQKFNERLVDRCRRLGLVLSHGIALDKNISSKMKEVKDIVATKEQAQRKILELKALMQQVSDDKLDSDISLAKIENDESYARGFRFESRLASRGASSISPEDHTRASVEKPRGLLGTVVDSPGSSGPEYTQFVRGTRPNFTRDLGERESAFVPVQNVAHLDPTRDKNKRSSNVENCHGDMNNEIKAPRVTGGASLLRRVIDGYPGNAGQLDAQRQQRSSSARATLVPPQSACNTLPNNLFRSSYSKSPPSMQSSSGVGSMNSRSMASLDNCRNDLPYVACNMPRIASRNFDPDDNIGPRGYSERANLSSNNLNKSYRQPTRSSSFYSELDFRNQEVFPTAGWDDEALHANTSPIRPRSPPEFHRILSTIESQQITDELNRVLRCRNSDDTLPQQNWWSSSSELGQAERHAYIPEHQNYGQRGKPLINERTTSECYSQIMQLHLVLQEITQQIRNLTVTVAANKTATRDALLQHRFDLHNVTRLIREVSDLVSDSMKRVESQVGNQTRMIMDMESRMRRIEENQRLGSQKYELSRDREWQVPGRPDFMVSQDLPFSYTRDAMRERENSASGSSMLNNQIPPGTRANNYWDNFRSHSRQNMLSKSNANQHFTHEASPSATENPRYTSSDALNNSQPASGTSDLSSEARRNGSGKNLWATSGFYENMSSKKRNKDQKSQSSTISSIGKTGSGNVPTNSAAEPLVSSRDSQPEPDDSTIINRPQIYSRSPPRMSPYRRDPDSSAFSRLSDFDLSWTPASAGDAERKHRYDSESTKSVLPSSTGATSEEQQSHRYRETSPSLHFSSSSRADREKHRQDMEMRYRAGGTSNLDDTRSSNQDPLNTSEDSGAPNWVVNALEAVNSTDDLRRSLVSPPLSIDRRSFVSPQPTSRAQDNKTENGNVGEEQSERAELQGRSSSPPNTQSPAVSMNIRCEESAASGENTLDQNGRRSSESTSNNI